MQVVEIRVKGHIDKQWSKWLGDLAAIHTDQDETVMTGTVADQAGVYGLIARLQAVGLPLLSVSPGGVNLEFVLR